MVWSLERDLPPSSLTTSSVNWPRDTLCRPVHYSEPVQNARQETENSNDSSVPRERYQEVSVLPRAESERDPSRCLSGSPPSLGHRVSPAPPLPTEDKPRSSTPCYHGVTDSFVAPVETVLSEHSCSPDVQETDAPHAANDLAALSSSPSPHPDGAHLVFTTPPLVTPTPTLSDNSPVSQHSVEHVGASAPPTIHAASHQPPLKTTISVSTSCMLTDITTPTSTTSTSSIPSDQRGEAVISSAYLSPMPCASTSPLLATPLTHHWYPTQLPSDKDSLTKLRMEMSMELLWVEQAISSRKKVGVAS